MSDEEEYYFEDDYGDDEQGDDEEVGWETEIENDYAEAKSLADQSLERAITGFQGVIASDQDKGRWTFKALKGIYRTCCKHHDDARTVKYYEQMLAFQWAGRNRNDIEKAINKFIDRASYLQPATLGAIYRVTLDAVTKEEKSFDKLCFNIRLKMAQLALNEERFEDLTAALVELHAWCANDEQRKGSQLLHVYSLEIQLYTERYDPVRIRDIYAKAILIKSAIAPPRVMGVIQQSGGKMHMRQSMWDAATESFSAAFRCFDEAGDGRRIKCLKYLVLATMLSGSAINPFHTNEAKSYQTDPEIVAMTELIAASTSNDIGAFDRVMKRNTKSFTEDTFLYLYLEPLIRKIRRQVLRVMTKPYRALRLDYIAAELGMTAADVESMCVAMVLDGQLHGAIDQLEGVLVLHEANGRAAAESDGPLDRQAVLQSLIQKELSLHGAITSRVSAQ
jgi:COP9 signalosome complex subunit 2